MSFMQTKYFVVTLVLALSFTGTAPAGEERRPPKLGVGPDLVEDLGGEQGVHNLVASLFHYIMLDNRINHIFAEFGNPQRQVELNTQFVQMLAGKPVDYQGASMSAAHADLGITMTEFNHVVDALYNACERTNVSYYDCNKVVGILAPFTRSIVTR